MARDSHLQGHAGTNRTLQNEASFLRIMQGLRGRCKMRRPSSRLCRDQAGTTAMHQADTKQGPQQNCKGHRPEVPACLHLMTTNSRGAHPDCSLGMAPADTDAVGYGHPRPSTHRSRAAHFDYAAGHWMPAVLEGRLPTDSQNRPPHCPTEGMEWVSTGPSPASPPPPPSHLPWPCGALVHIKVHLLAAHDELVVAVRQVPPVHQRLVAPVGMQRAQMSSGSPALWPVMSAPS